MALIKPIDYKGFTPYWWVIKEVREDRLNNKTDVILCLYADSESEFKDTSKSNYISGIFQSAILDGIGYTDEELISGVLSSDNTFFNDATNTDGSYNLIDNQSPIYLQISNDPITGYIRYAECIKHTFIWRNNIIIITLRIYFEVDGIIDPSLTKDITWIVDDFNNIPNTTIGECTYFNSMRLNNNLTDEEVITAGIQYGDQSGYVDKRLYGNSF